MRRLRYGNAARRDLIAIARFIRDASSSRSIGEGFAKTLQQRCERLARLPGLLGRQRPELRPDIRSLTFREYVIFFRYLDDSVEIVRILERHRDVAAEFEGKAGS